MSCHIASWLYINRLQDWAIELQQLEFVLFSFLELKSVFKSYKFLML